MSLKLYFDFMSQPSRALYIFLKQTKIPFEACPVALRKGEHLTEKYKLNVSRFQKVPVINQNNFKLTESIAIVRYLTRENKLGESLYPQDSKLQARVDEYLEWQHNNVRVYCGLFFRLTWMEPMMTGQQPPVKKVQEFLDNMDKVLDDFQELWLQSGPYITGDKISAADIFAACEIEQPRLGGYDPCLGRPVLAAWLEQVRKGLGKDYEEAHTFLNRYSSRVKQLAANKL